jgi:hypothetical protein
MPSSSIVTFPSTTNAREYWRVESRHCGTDWDTLGRAAARVFWRLQLTSSLAWSST